MELYMTSPDWLENFLSFLVHTVSLLLKMVKYFLDNIF